MEVHYKIKKADFELSDKLIIRYKKNYGYWIQKEINDQWYTCTNSFRINPYGIGFKEQYGFSYDDLKPFLFNSFDEALTYIDLVDKFEYCEYNPETHEKYNDSIMRKGKIEEICIGIVEELIKSRKNK